jgi:hypothetical protein
VPIVAGSVTSSSEVHKRMIAPTQFRHLSRGLEGFAPLVARNGYERQTVPMRAGAAKCAGAMSRRTVRARQGRTTP